CRHTARASAAPSRTGASASRAAAPAQRRPAGSVSLRPCSVILSGDPCRLFQVDYTALSNDGPGGSALVRAPSLSVRSAGDDGVESTRGDRQKRIADGWGGEK